MYIDIPPNVRYSEDSLIAFKIQRDKLAGVELFGI